VRVSGFNIIGAIVLVVAVTKFAVGYLTEREVEVPFIRVCDLAMMQALIHHVIMALLHVYSSTT